MDLNKISKELQKLEQQKKDIEEKRKQKDEAFDSRLEQVKQKKDEVDLLLSDEIAILKYAKEKSQNAINRLKEIVYLDKVLKKKAGNPKTQEEEKIEISLQLKLIALELEVLNKTVKNAEDVILPTLERIKPIKAESGKLKREIDDIRDKQKEEIGELDKTLSKIMEKIDDKKKKMVVKVRKKKELTFSGIHFNI
jgi:hypothetical protein